MAHYDEQREEHYKHIEKQKKEVSRYKKAKQFKNKLENALGVVAGIFLFSLAVFVGVMK